MLSILSIIGCMTGIFITIVNILALVTIFRYRFFGNPSNIWIASLSSSDLISGLTLTMLCILLSLYIKYDQMVACVVMQTFMMMTTHATVSVSVLVSIDRFVSISNPFLYQTHVTKKRVVVSVFVIWILAASTSAVTFTIRVVGNNTCDEWSQEGWLIFSSPFYLNIPICGIMYGFISYEALRQRRQITAQRNLVWATHQTLGETFLQKMRAVKMFVVVFGLFFAFWLPMLIIIVIHNFINYVPSSLRRGLFLLGNMNSCFNVFIYLLLNQDFRMAFKRLFRRLRR